METCGTVLLCYKTEGNDFFQRESLKRNVGDHYFQSDVDYWHAFELLSRQYLWELELLGVDSISTHTHTQTHTNTHTHTHTHTEREFKKGDFQVFPFCFALFIHCTPTISLHMAPHRVLCRPIFFQLSLFCWGSNQLWIPCYELKRIRLKPLTSCMTTVVRPVIASNWIVRIAQNVREEGSVIFFESSYRQ